MTTDSHTPRTEPTSITRTEYVSLPVVIYTNETVNCSCDAPHSQECDCPSTHRASIESRRVVFYGKSWPTAYEAYKEARAHLRAWAKREREMAAEEQAKVDAREL